MSQKNCSLKKRRERKKEAICCRKGIDGEVYITSKEKELLTKGEFVVLDIETTERSPLKGGRLIELAAVKIKNGEAVAEFSTVINPCQKIPAKITEITGITNEDVEGQPTYGQVLPSFKEFIGDAIIVAHNARFDWNTFLLFYFKNVGIYPTNDVLDTLAMFRRCMPDSPKHSLDVMCETCKVSLEGHHRALNDVYATAKCFLLMQRRMLTYPVQEEAPEGMKKIATRSIILDVDKVEMSVYPTLSTKIMKVNYWEKAMSKKQTLKRVYVTICEGRIYGRVYFELEDAAWYNKDFPYALDFQKVEDMVLRYLTFNTKEHLASFAARREESEIRNA